MHPEDGRIHASFNQTVAATGRLSSSDPNLQNIPVRREEGRQIRQAFVADRPGFALLTADYSQIELRILAHYSADPALCRAFERGEDIHCAVASRIFGVPESQVDESQRRVAKTFNFGVVYASPSGSSRSASLRTEAAAFIEAYFQGVRRRSRSIHHQDRLNPPRRRVASRPLSWSGVGRISGISPTTVGRNLAERTAINTVIQGSAADLIKRAMILLDDRLRGGGFQARMLLQIHDELVFEAPQAEVARLAELVRHAMTTALDLNVPLTVDIAAGPNWLDVVSIPKAPESQ